MPGLRCLLMTFALALLVSQVARGATCTGDSSHLCLQEQRFQISVDWTDSSGQRGKGTAVGLTSDTGYFWFFSATNLELIIKVLDGRQMNGHFWVFYGALSDVAYTIKVRDTVTGKSKTYTNPSGRLASAADTSAFPALPANGVAASPSRPPDPLEPVLASSTTGCDPTQTTLCLNNGRFRISVLWRDPQGNTGRGQAVSLTGDTGYFWFFTPSNVELVLKVLDGRGLNSSFWLFYGALTNVEYVVEVVDTETRAHKSYHNPSGHLASFADTSALQDTLNAGTYAAASYDRFLKALDDQIAPDLSPETAHLFYGLLDPAKELFHCLRRAAVSSSGVVCKGFDPQRGSYLDVLVSPDEARWMASLLALDADAMESRSSAASFLRNGSRASSPRSVGSESAACISDSEDTAAWYLACELFRSDALTLLGSVAHWACVDAPRSPIPKPVCYAIVAADISVGILKVFQCNTRPLYMTRLFVVPSDEILLGFDDSKNFEVMGDFENRPEGGSIPALVKKTVQTVLELLDVPSTLIQEALDPITDAVLERIGDATIDLSRVECTGPVSSLIAAADADIVTGGGVTLDGRTIQSRQQEAFGYIRPRIRLLAPWGYVTGTSTPFKVERKNCSGSGKYKLETFHFPTSGGPAELPYAWYRTNTTCDGRTTSHEIYPGTTRFVYPGAALSPSCPIFRCNGQWVSYHFPGSKRVCEWTPENPYLCTIEEDWSVDFVGGILTTQHATAGTGHWTSGRVIAIDSHSTSQYDFSTGVFSGKSASEWIYTNELSGCLDWIDDAHRGFSYVLPAEEPTCKMVDWCPQ